MTNANELLQIALDGRDPDYSTRYRGLVLDAFGFKPEAIAFIKAKSSFLVAPSATLQGWYPPPDLDGAGRIVLRYFQAEGCVHENAHVHFHWVRQEVWLPKHRLQLAKDLVFLADSTSPVWAEATDLAYRYVYGDGAWEGMFAEVVPLEVPVLNLHQLIEADLPQINDWEIFAGLCSFTMGKFRTGKRQLPSGFWWPFEPMLTGEVLVKPYYE